jgi:oligoendopeptidase F
MPALSALLERTRADYLALHTAKEDLFWTVKMGLADDKDAASRALADAEIALNGFLQDPERLAALVGAQSEVGAQSQVGGNGDGDREGERAELAGWIRMLRCHTLEDASARALSADIVQAEAELQRARGGMALGYHDPRTGQFERASTNKLALLVANDPDERVRRAAHEGLRSIEPFVLANGFLEIVKLRNRLGRSLGFDDYYDWKVSVAEGMRKRDVFARLEAFLSATAQRTREELARFAGMHGASVLEPWNFGYVRAGALAKELDPYFPFAESFARWGRSFAALGVRYRGALLTLDLVDRAGKYENGFMHGPGPTWFDGGAWVPARINFTANAVPGAVGSGLRATETFFHEGGHAAHFANITEGSPCFSMEFAPTSVAYAETQSMFMDSLLSDPDWQRRYALGPDGAPMPFDLVERSVREAQPFRGWDTRRLITVPMGERAIYELPEAELTADRVLTTLRQIERDTQGLTSAPRPILAVPHLLAGESSAYYHAYVLAEMAVQQTRAHFLAVDGYLTDNPRIGPAIEQAYWVRGNRLTHDETLVALTGQPLSADALVAEANRTVDEALAEARATWEAAATRPAFTGAVALGAAIRLVHGREEIANTEVDGFEGAARKFAAWVHALEHAAKAAAVASATV